MKKIFYALLCAMLLVTVGCEKEVDKTPTDDKQTVDQDKPSKPVEDEKVKYSSNLDKYNIVCDAGDTSNHELGIFKISGQDVKIGYTCQEAQTVAGRYVNLNINGNVIETEGAEGYIAIFNDNLIMYSYDQNNGTELIEAEFYDVNGKKLEVKINDKDRVYDTFNGYRIELIGNEIHLFDTHHRCGKTKVYDYVFKYENNELVQKSIEDTIFQIEDIACKN